MLSLSFGDGHVLEPYAGLVRNCELHMDEAVFILNSYPYILRLVNQKRNGVFVTLLFMVTFYVEMLITYIASG